VSQYPNFEGNRNKTHVYFALTATIIKNLIYKFTSPTEEKLYKTTETGCKSQWKRNFYTVSIDMTYFSE
jgi:hypothetical protein